MKKFLFIALLFYCLSIGAQEINWVTFEEAIELNKKEPRKIIVDVYTDWCGYCKIMDKNTFGNEKVAAYINATFYAVKFNAEQKEDVVYDNKTFKFQESGARGYHELAAALLNNQLSYPSIVLLDEEVRIFHVVKGYQKPEPFDKIIKYFGEDIYKDTSWEDFLAAYNSPFSAN